MSTKNAFLWYFKEETEYVNSQCHLGKRSFICNFKFYFDFSRIRAYYHSFGNYRKVSRKYLSKQ